MLEKSGRHLFGPTFAPAQPPKQQVISIAVLSEKLSYLKASDLKLVRKAFHFADEAHLGQYRQSGEPYITHPLAVAELCAEWKLDVYSIMSALLHDVIEDTGHTYAELIETFGQKVGELVDGLTKLDKLEFQSHAQAQARDGAARQRVCKLTLPLAHLVASLRERQRDPFVEPGVLVARQEARESLCKRRHGVLRDKQLRGLITR